MGFINYFTEFKTFLEEKATFADGATRDYLGQNFYWDGSTFPVTQPSINMVDSSGKKKTLQGGTFIGIDPDFAKKLGREPDRSQKVPVVIGNKADKKVPTQSDTAHGKPSPYGGETFYVPYSTYLWMIQPVDTAAMGGQPAAPPMM